MNAHVAILGGIFITGTFGCAYELIRTGHWIAGFVLALLGLCTIKITSK
jgi:hypothetical protein